MTRVRPAAVSGSFYPGERAALTRTVDSLLADAKVPAHSDTFPKAIIVPHAGYVYSGAVAASAYALLREQRTEIRRVVLLGPTHRVPIAGMAVPDADSFATPLGNIVVDQTAIASIANLPQVVVSAAVHAREHSLEVQLPFLQRVLDDFRLVPIAVGDASPAEVAQVLDILWGGNETLIVISSDLSHYLPYETARKVDSATIDAILALSENPIGHDQACGGTPVSGLILAARRRRLRPKLLDLRNSGDTAGGRDQVVGYAALSFSEVHHA